VHRTELLGADLRGVFVSAFAEAPGDERPAL
jgi:hypothetical protein